MDQHQQFTRINPNATLAVCDRCGEHAPAMKLRGWNPETGRDAVLALCWGCAVAEDQTALLWPMGEQLQATLEQWIREPHPLLDCTDDEFYAALDTGKSWTAHELRLEAMRQARKAYIASCMEGVAA